MTQLERLKQEVKALLSEIENLEKQNIIKTSEAARYEIGLAVLFFTVILTNTAWLAIFLGG